MSRRSRTPEWFLTLAMGIGGGLPLVGFLAFSPAVWAAITAGVLFWPCAFIGGCVGDLLWARKGASDG